MNLLKYTAVLFFTASLTLTAFANPNMGKMQKMKQTPIFNIQTIETVSGEVKSLDTCTNIKNKEMQMGVCFTLLDKTNKYSVHVGPSWYLAEKNIQILVGDKLKVTGSKVMLNNKSSIIASEIKKNDLTIQLRDENGFPLWSKNKGKKGNR